MSDTDLLDNPEGCNIKNELVNFSAKRINLPSLDELQTKLDMVPKQVFRLYGCLACSWRNTVDCPVFDDKAYSSKFPMDGICARRKAWLLVLTPDYSTPVSLSQWKRDFMLSLGSINMEREFTVIADYEAKLNSLNILRNINDDSSRKRYNLLNNQLENRKKYSLQLWNQVLRYTDNQVDRDTIKRVEVKKTILKPSDVAQLLRDIPVDGEVIEDDE
jgi:hypothetical protein